MISSYRLSRAGIRSRPRTTHIGGMPVYWWNNGKKTAILYLHGGAYVSNPSQNQVHCIDEIACESNATLVMPLYPLAPENTFERTYELLDLLYPELLSRYEHVAFVGDSAGAGMALGFAMHVRDQGLPQPRDIVLISPWLDVNTDNPDIARYADKDADLDAERLRLNGLAWAGSEDATRDCRVSPIFGDLDGLGRISIFMGTCDILFPDALKLHGMLDEKGIGHDFFVAEGMPHDYPLMSIPEGREARERIARIVKGA